MLRLYQSACHYIVSSNMRNLLKSKPLTGFQATPALPVETGTMKALSVLP
jgi:hypothetical protein